MRLFWLLTFCLSATSDAGKLLFYSSARIGQSHVFFMAKLADTLSEAGHNVTFYQQEVYKSVNKVGVQKAKAVVRASDVDVGEQPYEDVWQPSDSFLGEIKMFKNYSRAIAAVCESQLRDDAYLNGLKAENYDLAVLEYFDVCGFAIMAKIGIKKYISTTAMFVQHSLLNDFGLPLSLSTVPGMSSAYGSRMTYWQRLNTLIIYPIQKIVFHYMFTQNYQNVIWKYYSDNFDHADMMPVSQKVVFVGGIEPTKQNKSIPKDLSQILSTSKRGVVLVSFGTIARAADMPMEAKRALVDAFSQFPDVEFIWKYEVDDGFGENVTNLHKIKWLPQASLLTEPKVLAFMTHGGLNSFTEAAYRGKPVVCVPLFADQLNNCYAASEKHLGVVLNKLQLSTETVARALDQVLNNPSYAQKAEHFARMMSSKPFSARDRIIGYVNHALEFDVHDALDLPTRSMSFIQIHFIDVLLPLVSVVLVVIVVMVRLLIGVRRKAKLD